MLPVRVYVFFFTRNKYKCFVSSGGGVALLHASKGLDKLQTRSEDQRRGVEIIQSAIKVLLE